MDLASAPAPEPASESVDPRAPDDGATPSPQSVASDGPSIVNREIIEAPVTPRDDADTDTDTEDASDDVDDELDESDGSDD